MAAPMGGIANEFAENVFSDGLTAFVAGHVPEWSITGKRRPFFQGRD
jgi:hypothetical protein